MYGDMHRGRVVKPANEAGSSLVEAALLISLISLAVIPAVNFLTDSTSSSIEDSSETIETIAGGQTMSTSGNPADSNNENLLKPHNEYRSYIAKEAIAVELTEVQGRSADPNWTGP